MIEITETPTAASADAPRPMVSGEAPCCAGFDDILSFLNGRSAGLDLENIHWIRGEAGPNWCHDCGKTMAKHLRRRAPRKERREYILDGGFPSGDEDGCARCEGCGKLLHYSLTDYGAESELEHFLEHWKPQDKIEPETAYELARVFEYGQHVDELTEDLGRLAGIVRRQIEA